LAKGGTRVAALMFNVKGPDLLWLDKPAIAEPGLEAAYAAAGWKDRKEELEKTYASLELEPTPFANFNIFAPFKPGQEARSYSGRVDLAGFNDQHTLNTPRNMPGESERVFPILWSLERLLAYPHRIFDFRDLDDKLFGFIYELRESKVKSIDDLNKKFEEINRHFNDTGDHPQGPEPLQGPAGQVRGPDRRGRGRLRHHATGGLPVHRPGTARGGYQRLQHQRAGVDRHIHDQRDLETGREIGHGRRQVDRVRG
jgi:hypothetical protein